MPTFGDWRLAAATMALASILGTALWFHIGYEPDAGSHRIELTTGGQNAGEGLPRMVLHLGHGVIAQPQQVDSAGATWFDDGAFSPRPDGGTITYSGPVGSTAHLTWTGGTADATVDLSVDGTPVRTVAMPAGQPGSEAIEFELALPRSSWLLLAVLIAWMSLPSWLVVRRVLTAAASSGPVRSLAAPVALALAAAITLTLALPVGEARTRTATVEVEALSPSPLGSAGAEVWVRVADAGGKNLRSAQLGHPDWVEREPFVVGNPGAEPLRSRINVGPGDRLEFASISHSGVVEVTVDGVTEVVDTFDRERSIEFGAIGGGSPAATARRLLAWSTTFVSITIGFLVLVLLVGGRAGDRSNRPTLPVHVETPPYWLVPQMMWTTALVVFWPGLMSPDSLAQWSQLEHRTLSNWHPFTTTLMIGLLRWVVDSPWLPILITVTCASLALGGVGRLAARRGCPRGVVLASLLTASASPALLLMGIALWKDVVMGVAILGVSLALWHMLDDPGWLVRHRRNVVVMVAALSMVWLSRHNGWPIVLATLGAVALVRPTLRRQIGGLALAVLVVTFVVNQPLARLLDVEPNPTGGIAYLQRVSAHVNAGTHLDPGDRAFLEELRPLDAPWPYDCSSVQPTWAGPDSIAVSSYEGREGELLRLAATLSARNPEVEAGHLACSTRLIWRLAAPDTETFLVESGVDGPIGDTIPTWFADSPMEAYPSRRLATGSLDRLSDLPSPLRRPAIYLIPFAFAVVAASVGRRSLDPLLVASPALFQVASIAPFVLVQDTRFLFGAMLVAAAFTPLLATVEHRVDAMGPLSWPARTRFDGPWAPMDDDRTAQNMNNGDDSCRSIQPNEDRQIDRNGLLRLPDAARRPRTSDPRRTSS